MSPSPMAAPPSVGWKMMAAPAIAGQHIPELRLVRCLPMEQPQSVFGERERVTAGRTRPLDELRQLVQRLVDPGQDLSRRLQTPVDQAGPGLCGSDAHHVRYSFSP